MDHTDPTAEPITEARHELRIMRAECEGRSYVAYCPCGGFVAVAGRLDFLSWSYRKHLNAPSVPADA